MLRSIMDLGIILPSYAEHTMSEPCSPAGLSPDFPPTFIGLLSDFYPTFLKISLETVRLIGYRLDATSG